ncbi:MAG: glycosyltransferase family 4 protein [Nitrospirales bacterium]|nr:glycosyltransferase family 4 protein [Nitrospirales bacterium]
MNDVSPKENLKIAFCPPELQPFQFAMRGEPTNATYLLQSHIARRLISRGHELSFIAGRDLGENVFTRDLDQPESAPLTWSRSLPFELLRKLTWRIQQIFGVPYLNIFTNLRLYDAGFQCLPGHDVVYERNGLYRNGIAMACRRLKIPYVLFVEADEILEHDYMGEPLAGLLRKSAQRQFHYNLETADRVICVSDQLKNHLVTKWGILAEKIIVLSNGVDVEQFQPDHNVRNEIRQTLGIEDNPLILFVGNFYEWHDVRTVLASFPDVLTFYPNARLVLVGDGSMRESMEKYSVDLGISHAVDFTGLIPHRDVPRYMTAADIAVVPYPRMDQGNWLSPLKLFEYMASGRAIVASAVGQVESIIRHEKNGLLVSAGNTKAMADAILRLIEDKDLRVDLGRQARDDAVQNHSWEKYISQLETIFEEVIRLKSDNHR